MTSTPPQPQAQPPTAAPTTTTTTTTSSTPDFAFPPIYSFPPFFTLQPNPTTLSSQLLSWSTLIQSYCRAHHLFALTLIDALPTPLFTNTALSRTLALKDARAVVAWMASPEGGNRAEWISAGGGSNGKAAKASSGGEDAQQARAWIFWKRPEEWAGVLEEWVERTGQRGSVITLYEIAESDATRREAFHGMDAELLQRSLRVCVKRGKAQVFGAEGSEGVKFF